MNFTNIIKALLALLSGIFQKSVSVSFAEAEKEPYIHHKCFRKS